MDPVSLISLGFFTYKGLQKLCAEEGLLPEVLGEGVNKGIAGTLGTAAALIGKVSQSLATLHHPENHIIARAAIRVYWTSLAQLTASYARIQQTPIDHGFETIPVAHHLTALLDRHRPTGILSQTAVPSLRDLYKFAREQQSKETLWEDHAHERIQPVLNQLEATFGAGESRSWAHAALSPIFDQFPGLTPEFRAWTESLWDQTFAINFQQAVHADDKLRTQLFGEWLAKIRIGDRGFSPQQWEQQLEAQANRIIREVQDVGRLVLESKNEILDRLTPQKRQPQPQVRDLPNLREQILGRESEATQLLTDLRQATNSIVALIAPPGFGKTALLVRVLQQVTDGVTIQEPNLTAIVAHDCRSSHPSTAALSGILSAATGESLTSEQAIAALPQSGRLWWIWDNAEHLLDPNGQWRSPELAALIQQWREHQHHSVLILISRRTPTGYLPHATSKQLMSGLPEASAVQLLNTKLTGTRFEKDPQLPHLAKRLHNVPQALVNAAGYLIQREAETDLAAFLRSDLLAAFDDLDTDRAIQKLINAHLDRLDPKALRLLKQTATLQEPIPEKAAVLLDTSKRGLVTQLIREQLLQSEQQMLVGILLRLHPLIAEIVQNRGAIWPSPEWADAIAAWGFEVSQRHEFRLTLICGSLTERAYRNLLKHRHSKYEHALATALINKGVALRVLGRLKESLGCYDEGISLLRELVKQGSRKLAKDLIPAVMNKGVTLDLLGRLEDGQICHSEAINLHRELLSEGCTVSMPDLAGILMNKGVGLRALGRLGEALDCQNESIAILRQAVKQGGVEFTNRLAMVMANKGHVLSSFGRLKEAVNCYDESIDLRRELVNNGRREFMNELAVVVMNKGSALVSLGCLEEAFGCFDEAIFLLQGLVKQGQSELADDLATVLYNKAIAQESASHYPEALESAREAASLWSRMVASGWAHLAGESQKADQLTQRLELLTGSRWRRLIARFFTWLRPKPKPQNR